MRDDADAAGNITVNGILRRQAIQHRYMAAHRKNQRLVQGKMGFFVICITDRPRTGAHVVRGIKNDIGDFCGVVSNQGRNTLYQNLVGQVAVLIVTGGDTLQKYVA